jgi:DNA ligase-4
VQIPKSEKAQGCAHALEFLQGSSKVWAETKYDGERAQIHVEIRPDNTSSHITIFSKSKRDSTNDRHGVHTLIRSALGLDGTCRRRPSGTHRVTQNVILDAEMVAFRGDKVDGKISLQNGKNHLTDQ